MRKLRNVDPKKILSCPNIKFSNLGYKNKSQSKDKRKNLEEVEGTVP